ncbi:hypothetical protein EVAR_35388_1 [Eumeta japonica]|uniref:Uncharacterized protein n=1 Tax=Eumeta variegata TaxID=151549 RepID=A0A4C1XCN1_EUMVA|nr:hypothetical protein EVAR_35388_1 [Eumeta japonica]
MADSIISAEAAGAAAAAADWNGTVAPAVGGIECSSKQCVNAGGEPPPRRGPPVGAAPPDEYYSKPSLNHSSLTYSIYSDRMWYVRCGLRRGL